MTQHHHHHHHPPKTIQENLTLQILRADRLVKSAKQLQPSSSKFNCTSNVSNLADQLTHLLRSTARLIAGSTTTFYNRPLRSIFKTLTVNLEQAQTLVRKCKHRTGILRQVFAITTAADIQKVSNLLESSIADLNWLLSIFLSDNHKTSVNLSLPPIATNNPVLALVWSNIATIHHSTILKDRVDAANSLDSLARDNDRNKKMIIEEDGIPPLLKLLKEAASLDSQISAASTLYNLATDRRKVAAFVRSLAVPTIVQILNDSTTVVIRTNVISLVSRMAEIDSWAQEEFGRENVIRLIVTFLATDIVVDDENVKTYYSSSSLSYHNKKELMDFGSPEEKLKMKISCGKALWVLAKGNLLNSRKITETKALICLAKLMDHENEELKLNCLMTVMDLAIVAESNADLRRQAFKPTLPAARMLLDRLLGLVSREISNPKLAVPAITTIGSLARTFPVKETRIIGPLVSKLENEVTDIANEAVIALTKFVCPENFNCMEHSKAILEFDGVSHLISFMKRNDDNMIQLVHGLKLLCYLALHVGNSKGLEQARALSVIECASARSVLTQYPGMKELFAKVIHHLNLYQAKTRTHLQTYVA